MLLYLKNQKLQLILSTVKNLKTARGRKISSIKWLERHLNDPFVNLAKQKGYRSRAAFKLVEINEKYNILKDAKIVIDIGAAPGGWLQVLKEKCSKNAKIIGIDLKEIDPIDGVICMVGDFTLEENTNKLQDLLDAKADLILSDMAANACGDRQIDHLRIVGLAEIALEFTLQNLCKGGNFVAKMLKGAEEKKLLDEMRKYFSNVRYFKPKASYDESAEIYIVALGFK
ncbi:23S rRNA methylase [Reticulomyxa filosa]|uniref:rRNA methyltransferase 2, mitochondrial n=1 Tax=Reticulomyxa filosa TaxID=46433 RepID=X6PA95_RETFI|nr:23S rRNA methylase [Reticulomyxa filosa]|eukprot:ETO34572.1 23S rRNA methylase [Reticulomyxa filosa]